MSDVGRLRRSGGTVFPSVRKSADPFVPESGEMDFSQELSEFDAQSSTSVRESEATEQTVIRDENRRKQFKYKKKHQKEDEEETSKEEKEEEVLVDLSA
jgi:hypothetical protein